MSNQEEDQELTPTPEQVEGFSQRIRATIAHAAFDKFCAGLQSSQLLAHTKHAGCLLIPQLAKELLLLEVGEDVAIGATTRHAEWMNFWPFEALVATNKEIFFVSKSYEWAGAVMPKVAISTGELGATHLLGRLCNQEETYLYAIDDPRMIYSATLLSDGNPIKVYKSVDDVPIMQTREWYEKKDRSSADSAFNRVENHFLG